MRKTSPVNKLDKETFDILMCKAYCPEACPNAMEEKIRTRKSISQSRAFTETMLERVDKLIEDGVYDEFPIGTIMDFRYDLSIPGNTAAQGKRVHTHTNKWLIKAKVESGRRVIDRTTFITIHTSFELNKALRDECVLFDMTLSTYALQLLEAGHEAYKQTIQKQKRKLQELQHAREKIYNERKSKNRRLFD